MSTCTSSRSGNLAALDIQQSKRLSRRRGLRGEPDGRESFSPVAQEGLGFDPTTRSLAVLGGGGGRRWPLPSEQQEGRYKVVNHCDEPQCDQQLPECFRGEADGRERPNPTADIASFRETVTDLDQRLTTVEDYIMTLPDQDAELRFLRAKVTDLEDRSRRDNVCFFGIPEHKEGSDIKTFLKNLLPELTGLDFSPPLEFQRAHRIGPIQKATSGRSIPLSHASYATTRLARLSQLPNPKAHTPWRVTRSEWQRAFPG
ncbi:hypothetical protein NDU88_003621 [Pleurodeles waltl]|uniref:Uncharacterized protein n=1 Tax=Pleurodeles waltl TaxID=8319 RepID=A0AAV7KYZ9_PLEWA|nr:hypothetical protein NDU88_003621 [Pleurodeles waltl]